MKFEIHYLKGEYSEAKKEIAYMKSIDDDWILADLMECYILLDEWENDLCNTKIKKVMNSGLHTDEVVRIFWIVQYRLWNHEKWLDNLLEALDMNPLNWDTLFNIIETMIIWWDHLTVMEILEMIQTHHKEIKLCNPTSQYYDNVSRDALDFLQRVWHETIPSWAI